MGGPDMGGLILYGACNGGPGIVRNVPNPANGGKHLVDLNKEKQAHVSFFNCHATKQPHYEPACSECPFQGQGQGKELVGERARKN